MSFAAIFRSIARLVLFTFGAQRSPVKVADAVRGTTGIKNYPKRNDKPGQKLKEKANPSARAYGSGRNV